MKTEKDLHLTFSKLVDVKELTMKEMIHYTSKNVHLHLNYILLKYKKWKLQ